MLRWCPSTYRYIDGPLKPLPQNVRKRIPRINVLSKQDSETRLAISAFSSALSAGVPPEDALKRAKPRLDPATFDECCLAAASHATSDTRMQQKLLQKFSEKFELGRRLSLLSTAASISSNDSKAAALEILAQPVPGYSSDDYSRMYDEMEPSEQAHFEAALENFNQIREPILETQRALPHDMEMLRERWKNSIKYYHLNGYDYLFPLAKEIPDIVATLLAKMAAQMVTSIYPQSLTSLCRRIGFAIEAGLLSDLATRNGVHAAYSRSNFLWGLLGVPRWTAKDHIVVGSVYLRQALHKCTIDQVHPKAPTTKVARPAFWHTFYMDGKTKRGIVKINPAICTSIDPINPSSYAHLPMLMRPARWRTFRDGGYILPRGQTFLPVNGSQDIEQRVHIDRAVESDSMARNLDGIEALASTTWAVNSQVLEVVQDLFEQGSSLSDLPGRVASSADANTRKANQIDRVQHRQALKVAAALAKHGQKFWLPLYQDFRGRVYPIAGTKFSFMGSDSMRALFRFWHSRPLGDNGLDALFIHLANVYGFGTGKSYKQRVDWSKAHLADIQKTAQRPLDSEWWQAASKPFMTLAACFEIAEALATEDPKTFLSRLPIVQDGSCNGLQHYAALAKSRAGALAVNMIATPTPQDVYMKVSKSVAENGGKPLQRSVAKRAVIAAVFGQNSIGVVRGIGDALEDSGADGAEARENAKALSAPVVKALGENVAAAKEVQRWLVDCGRRVLSARRADVPAGVNSLKWTTMLGFPVVQSYGRGELMAIRTPLQAFYLQSPFHPPVADKVRHLRALPANFVHSLDASHLLLTAIAMRTAGHEIAAVHDGFWTHAGTSHELARILREQFVALHQENRLLALKEEWEKHYEGYMVLVNVHASSRAYDVLQRWRLGASDGPSQDGTSRTVSRRKPKYDLEAELIAEYMRLSKPPRDAASEITATTIVLGTGESVDYPATGPPRIGIPTTDKTQVWLPLEFSAPPQGDFDLKQVLDAPYFFN